jgi:hypothetical protein
MKFKYHDGVHLVLGILVESKKIVKKVFSIVEKDNDRHYYNGVTTHFSNPILLLSSYLNLYDEENPKFLKILIIARLPLLFQ